MLQGSVPRAVPAQVPPGAALCRKACFHFPLLPVLLLALPTEQTKGRNSFAWHLNTKTGFDLISGYSEQLWLGFNVLSRKGKAYSQDPRGKSEQQTAQSFTPNTSQVVFSKYIVPSAV